MKPSIEAVVAVTVAVKRAGPTNSPRRSAWSEVVVRGGIEPPTFRFSGLRITIQDRPWKSFSLLSDLRYTPMDAGVRGCMSSPVSSFGFDLARKTGCSRLCGLVCAGVLGGKQALEAAVAGRVVADAVVPALPDHIQPRSGEDPHRQGVVLAAGDRVVVDAGGPGAGVPGSVGEVADRVAELLTDGPAEGDGLVLAGLAGGRRGPGQADQRLGSGKRARQSPISVSSRAARTVPERGSEVKM